jgi:DNA-directed RNA polymerase subunit E'
MYRLVTFEDTVRVPPNLFSLKLEKAALSMLRQAYERTIDKKYGVILVVQSAKIKSMGKIIPGDGAAYFDVEFEALVFTPEVNEILDGEVSEIVEFGAFVKLGPIDGLLHVSQVANDFFSYDKKQGVLVGRQTKRVVKPKDHVRAKIATVSWKDSIPSSKIALTMRSEGLGKLSK